MVAPRYDAVLRDWWVVDFLYESSIVGRIFGDRKGRFADGRWIITSALKTPLRGIVDGHVVRTRNSHYLLVGTTN